MHDERVERLGAGILLLGLVQDEDGTEAIERAKECGLLTDAEIDAWTELDDEDRRLTLACLDAQFELRAAQWKTLELLLYVQTAPLVDLPPVKPSPAVGAEEGDWQPTMVMVPRSQITALTLQALNWHLAPPEGDR